MKPYEPRVGDRAHYVSFGTPGGEYRSACRAAVITEVGGWATTDIELLADPTARRVTQQYDPERCALTVLNPSGQFFNECTHDEGVLPGDPAARSDRCGGRDHRGGTWHWPEDGDW